MQKDSWTPIEDGKGTESLADRKENWRVNYQGVPRG